MITGYKLHKTHQSTILKPFSVKSFRQVYTTSASYRGSPALGNLLHPGRVENDVEHPFKGLLEKLHRPPEHPKMLRLQVGQKVLLGIPFFKKKEAIFVLDTPAEVTTPATLLHPYGIGQ